MAHLRRSLIVQFEIDRIQMPNECIKRTTLIIIIWIVAANLCAYESCGKISILFKIYVGCRCCCILVISSSLITIFTIWNAQRWTLERNGSDHSFFCWLTHAHVKLLRWRWNKCPKTHILICDKCQKWSNKKKKIIKSKNK